MNLTQAVKYVLEEVMAGERLDYAIADAAEESGLNPLLIARKVAETPRGATCGLNPAPAEPEAPTRRQRAVSLEVEVEDLLKLLGTTPEAVIPGYYAKMYPRTFNECRRVSPEITEAAFGAYCVRVGARKLDQLEAMIMIAPAEQLAAIRAQVTR